MVHTLSNTQLKKFAMSMLKSSIRMKREKFNLSDLPTKLHSLSITPMLKITRINSMDL